MNKIDLIIDALDNFLTDEKFEFDKLKQALSAARELKALKPVAYWWESANKKHYSLSRSKPVSDSTPLYALDKDKEQA